MVYKAYNPHLKKRLPRNRDPSVDRTAILTDPTSAPPSPWPLSALACLSFCSAFLQMFSLPLSITLNGSRLLSLFPPLFKGLNLKYMYILISYYATM